MVDNRKRKLTAEEILLELKKRRKELRDKFGVKRIGLFGSYVRGEQREDSDVDILVVFAPDARVDLIKFVELKVYLSELLGVPVDLVPARSLKPSISSNILKEVIYA